MTVLSGSPLNPLALGKADVNIGDEVVVFSVDSRVEFSRGTIEEFYDEPGLVYGRNPMVTLRRADGLLAHHSTQAIGLEPYPGNNWGRGRFVLGAEDALLPPEPIPPRWDNPNVLYML